MSYPTNWTFKPGDKIQIVRAFIIGFMPDAVIGFKDNEQWYLPGGQVEHAGGTDHLPYLVDYVREQTGLQLTGLSEAVAVSMNKTGVGAELAVFYLGQAEGTLTRGQALDPKQLPDFSPICRDAVASIQEIFGK